MINKNDCFDCNNCTKKDILNPNSKWICEITNKLIDNDGILENECEYFEYIE